MPTRVIASVLVMALGAACPRGNDGTPVRRPVDTAPETTRVTEPLPAGRVEAFFALHTGADQMTERGKEAGLVVVVRFADRELRQTIASCTDPALGSALGGGTARELEVAMCNGEFRLLSEPGVVRVTRTDKQPAGEVVATFALPAAAMRAVKPDSR